MLMVRKFTMAAAFSLLLAGSALAEDSNVAVVYLDGEATKTYTLTWAEVSKIELSGETVNVVPTTGETKSFAKSAVTKIDLHASAAGIDAVKGNESNVVVRTNGYAITVEGLANNAEVCAYDVTGKLVAKTTASNGTAQLDASAFNGVTIVKAADKSIKFIKK